jgi:hypothetical protein
MTDKEKLIQIKEFYKGCREELPNAKGTVITYGWLNWFIEQAEKVEQLEEKLKELDKFWWVHDKLNEKIHDNLALKDKINRYEQAIQNALGVSDGNTQRDVELMKDELNEAFYVECSVNHVLSDGVTFYIKDFKSEGEKHE